MLERTQQRHAHKTELAGMRSRALDSKNPSKTISEQQPRPYGDTCITQAGVLALAQCMPMPHQA
jgi:hypothetical protein